MQDTMDLCCRNHGGFDPTPRLLDRRCPPYLFRAGRCDIGENATAVDVGPFGVVITQSGCDLNLRAVLTPAVVALPKTVVLAEAGGPKRCRIWPGSEWR